MYVFGVCIRAVKKVGARIYKGTKLYQSPANMFGLTGELKLPIDMERRRCES